MTHKKISKFSNLQYELPTTTEADSIPFLSITPKNISLSDKFKADVVEEKGTYKQEDSETLHALSTVLRKVRSALAACQAVLNRKGSPACRKASIPFLFVLDPSSMKAFDDMVATYDARSVFQESSNLSNDNFKKNAKYFISDENRKLITQRRSNSEQRNLPSL